MKTFVALDGEGVTRQSDVVVLIDKCEERHEIGRHDYVLLGASDGTYVEDYAENGLSTAACLDFILQTAAANPGAILCGFYTSYDVNMILRDVDPQMLAHLWAGQQWTYTMDKAPFTSYKLQYVPNRLLTISRGFWYQTAEGSNKWYSEQNARWWDVFGFFQSSFVKALKEWQAADPETLEEIATMKDRRGVFDDDEKDRIRAYCIKECELLVGMMERVSDTLDGLDLHLTSWYGAGSVASAVLRREGVKAHINREMPDETRDAVMRAYFGGRIETFAVGIAETATYNYDVRSAYPAAIRNLPSLENCRWRHVRKWNPVKYPWAIWRVEWNCAGRLAPFPSRENKRIYWASSGAGWYHGVEVAAALDAFPGEIRVIEGWAMIPSDPHCKPFAFVDEMYVTRAQMKRDGDPREKMLKLALNSLYGKTAQAIGHGDEIPPYQCYYWAGYITAHCRAALLRAAAQKPLAILALATDGIFSEEPLDVPESSALGEWESKILDPGFMLIQPGVYATPDMSIVRTRGFSSKAVDYTTLRDLWERDGIGARMVVNDSRFIGMGFAVSTGRMEWWRRWIPGTKHIALTGSTAKYPDPWTLGSKLVRLLPPSIAPAPLSEPFTPRARPSYDNPEASLGEQPDLVSEGWY